MFHIIRSRATLRLITCNRRALSSLSSDSIKGETFILDKHYLSGNKKEHIAIYSFNRPEARNAISKKLLDEFETFVFKLSAHGRHSLVTDTRALIINSTLDNVFCAGADLKERMTFTDIDTASFLNRLNHLLNIVSGLRMPTISAVQGVALGGGAEIALSTDFRVFGKTAQFGLPETRLAILPGAGGTHRLSKLIGYSRALDLILTGRRVTCEEALALGICNRIADNALDSALDFSSLICQGGPLAISASKTAVRSSSEAAEIAAYSSVVNSRDKYEALLAFKEKRSPVFNGS